MWTFVAVIVFNFKDPLLFLIIGLRKKKRCCEYVNIRDGSVPLSSTLLVHCHCNNFLGHKSRVSFIFITAFNKSKCQLVRPEYRMISTISFSPGKEKIEQQSFFKNNFKCVIKLN